jgi:hypothetical protein
MENEQRKYPRVTGYAKALLVEPRTPGYIRDLSRTGCQIAFMNTLAVNVGDLIKVQVIAEHDPTISPFQICLRVRWIKPDPIWFALGGEIEEISCEEQEGAFERLVDYYYAGERA